ncbi:MAG: hypothetical protein Q8O72_10310, partial [Bacteroidales bacterium]|nr:hypothetical protein [Bacteroidales bacterium]
VDRLQLNELKVAFFLLGKSRKIKIKIMNEYIGFRHSIFRAGVKIHGKVDLWMKIILLLNNYTEP